MLTKVVLIIDKRKEQSIRYKKLIESSDIYVFIARDITDSIRILAQYEPDLILISDSIDESIINTIEKLRILSYTSRPVLISLSKSDHLQDKIEILNSGADDFLSEPIANEEFKARISAHLRRHFENNIYEKTKLFDSKISFKILKRVIHQNGLWAAMLIDIDNFDYYREIYGELAAEKMLQTYTAIINNALDKDDYLGQVAQDDFIIITSPLKAEKMAAYLIYAFNTIVDKFYSENDINRGYIVSQGDENAGDKISLVATKIGIISNEYKAYNNFRQAINSLIATHKLAKLKDGSLYVVERPKITAENAIQDREYNKKLLIVEPDEALSLLLQTMSEIQGYDVVVVNNYYDIFKLPDDFTPAVIILDAGNTRELKGIDVCPKIKADIKFENSHIILSTTLHDKERILNAGADLYLPKPYELSTVFNWVEKFMRKYND